MALKPKKRKCHVRKRIIPRIGCASAPATGLPSPRLAGIAALAPPPYWRKKLSKVSRARARQNLAAENAKRMHGTRVFRRGLQRRSANARQSVNRLLATSSARNHIDCCNKPTYFAAAGMPPPACPKSATQAQTVGCMGKLTVINAHPMFTNKNEYHS